MKITDAQRQAYVLHAVANHLAQNPTLPPVVITPYRPDDRARLQVHGPQPDLDSLIMWAGSLAVDHLRVHRLAGDKLHLHADGRLTGRIACGHGYAINVDVWGGADELADTALGTGDQVPVADLMVAATLGGNLAAALAAVRGDLS